ncbi:MAG: VCBS repeat-containing protein [Proteobacteria bacterium]|jgi:hypothetical protein|nr:VCBS repeat-containing protein [Pseudomonadota bacterium]
MMTRHSVRFIQLCLPLLMLGCPQEYEATPIKTPAPAEPLTQLDATITVIDYELPDGGYLGAQMAAIQCDGEEALVVIDPTYPDDRGSLYVIEELPDRGLHRIDTVSGHPLYGPDDGTKGAWTIASADVGRDGCDDYWLAGNSSAFLFEGNFAPYLMEQAISVVYGENREYRRDVDVKDVHEEGPTLLVQNAGFGRLYLGSAGSFPEEMYPEDARIEFVDSFGAMSLIDIDGDGALDVAEANGVHGLSVFLAPESGTYVRADADIRLEEPQGAQFGGSKLLVADFDGDGIEELIVPDVGDRDTRGSVYGFDDHPVGQSVQAGAVFTVEGGVREFFGISLTWLAEQNALLVGAYIHDAPALEGEPPAPDCGPDGVYPEVCVGDEGAVYIVSGPFEGHLEPSALIEATPLYHGFGENMVVAWDHLVVMGRGEWNLDPNELFFYPLDQLP